MKIVLTVKQKLELTEKFENRESLTKLAKDCGIRIHTIHEIKNNRMKLMEFVRDCDSGAEPSNHKSTKVFIQRSECCHSSVVQPEENRRNISLWSHVCTRSQVFHEALGLEGEFNASVVVSQA
jgi:hypothetical protein